jgi:hypothetical protein
VSDDQPQRALVDKLGVKAGMRVALVNITDAELVRVVAERTPAIMRDAPTEPVDVVVFEAATREDLSAIPQLAGSVARDGMLWVLWQKGRRELRQVHVQEAGLSAGLVDVKVASVSERLSGLKFVRRLADR